MNISSLIVHVRPEQLAATQAELRRWPGLQIHAASTDGKVIVTVETANDGETTATFDRINAVAGVMSAALVYHQFEPDPDGPPASDTAPDPASEQETRHATPDHLHAP